MDHVNQTEKKNEKLSGIFFRLLMVNVVLYFFSRFLKLEALTHIIIVIGAVLTLVCIISEAMSQVIDGRRLILLGFLLVDALMSFVITGAHVDSALVYSLFCFMSLLILFSAYAYLRRQIQHKSNIWHIISDCHLVYLIDSINTKTSGHPLIYKR